VHYVKRNFMPEREFLDIHTANQHLRTWVMERAGTREHGTTHKVLLYLFNEHEKTALLALPEEPFTLRKVRPVTVHPDCHVRIDKSYYSVPYIHVGQKLDAYISERVVEIYQGLELVATHERSLQPGEWHTRTVLDDSTGLGTLSPAQSCLPGTYPGLLPSGGSMAGSGDQPGGTGPVPLVPRHCTVRSSTVPKGQGRPGTGSRPC
jgi:hypothetical protein